MHDAFFVRGGKSPGNLLRVLDRFTGSERPVPQPVAQRLALQQFGDDIGRAPVLANVEDRKNVGMVQRSRRA
jgi:hypothetical protein